MTDWQWAKRTIYQMMRQYGTQVQVHKVTDISTNYQTGVKEVTKAVYKVRAVVLPIKSERKESYDFNTTPFLFDAKDFPSDYEWTCDDHIYVNGWYKVVEVENYESNVGWIIQAIKIDGSNLNITLTEAGSSAIEPTQEGDNES